MSIRSSLSLNHWSNRRAKCRGPTRRSRTEISELQHSLEAMRVESLTDPLTGLGNRKYFDRMIEVAVQNALANNEPLSLMMFDIDHFKSFNDAYGHLTGDQVHC